jgi:hypothetical protein
VPALAQLLAVLVERLLTLGQAKQELPVTLVTLELAATREQGLGQVVLVGRLLTLGQVNPA